MDLPEVLLFMYAMTFGGFFTAVTFGWILYSHEF